MSSTEIKVAIPTVHMNGTSAESLIDDAMKAYQAVGNALEAMRAVTPNARDYYVKGEEAAAEARLQHQLRVMKLTDVRDDLQTIILGIQDQQEERTRRRHTS